MDGILLIDKPSGMTSHDVVDLVRRKTGIKKVGHAGTLDPMATGLLVLLIGRATKKADTFINDDKTYQATIVFGIATDTGDSEGNIVSQKKYSSLRSDRIKEIIAKFIGEIEQVPPMYSAKKYKGRKLYEYARRHIEIERLPRKIVIKRIDILDVSKDSMSFEICCSKGTYIRQLAVDIGESLGCGAHVSSLRRIKSGMFDIKEALRIDKADSLKKESIYENIIRD